MLSPRCSVRMRLPEWIKITVSPLVPSAGPALIAFPDASYSAHSGFMSALWQPGETLLKYDASGIHGAASCVVNIAGVIMKQYFV